MTSIENAPKKKTARKPKAVAEQPVAEQPVTEVSKPAPKRATRKKTTAASIGAEERHHLIEVAAYYIAERRSFMGGSDYEDWVQAEKEVDQMIASGKFTAI